MRNHFNSDEYIKCAVTQCIDNATGLNIYWNLSCQKLCLKVMKIQTQYSETTVACVGNDNLEGIIEGELQKQIIASKSE